MVVGGEAVAAVAAAGRPTRFNGAADGDRRRAFGNGALSGTGAGFNALRRW